MQLVLEEVGPLNKRSSTACDNMEESEMPLTPEPSVSSAERIVDEMNDDLRSQTSSLLDDASSRYVLLIRTK